MFDNVMLDLLEFTWSLLEFLWTSVICHIITRAQKRMIKVSDRAYKMMHFKASLFPSLLIMPQSLLIMGFGLFG